MRMNSQISPLRCARLAFHQQHHGGTRQHQQLGDLARRPLAADGDFGAVHRRAHELRQDLIDREPRCAGLAERARRLRQITRDHGKRPAVDGVEPAQPHRQTAGPAATRHPMHRHRWTSRPGWSRARCPGRAATGRSPAAASRSWCTTRPATKVPLPRCALSLPLRPSRAMAWRTVTRLTPCSTISSGSLGRRWPARSSPESIRPSKRAASCW